jgi:hypothetical protein
LKIEAGQAYSHKAKSQITAVTKEKDDLAKQVEELKVAMGLWGTPVSTKVLETTKKDLEKMANNNKNVPKTAKKTPKKGSH